MSQAEAKRGTMGQQKSGMTQNNTSQPGRLRPEELVPSRYGDAVFAVGFEHPDWYNGFEHDPEEAARVRVRLLREMAETGGLLVATHLPFPSVGHVAVEGDDFRWAPVFWDY